MAHRVNSYRANSRLRSGQQQLRVIVVALVEREGSLLLTQLANGPFAGFWLLPSASVETGTVEITARRMVHERTGYAVIDQQLVSVIEEPRTGVLALRFVFRALVGERDSAIDDPEICQARFLSRDAVRELLEERDTVPNLGVMSLIRSWVEGRKLQPIETLAGDADCPCGSGFRFTGCCGWDAK